MTLSTLIDYLQQVVADHGDLPVFMYVDNADVDEFIALDTIPGLDY